MTAPEITLWHVLRQRPDGFKFRRQHPIGPYILDFYCASAGLAVEVDGIAHDLGENPARDEGATDGSPPGTSRLCGSQRLTFRMNWMPLPG